MHSDDRLETLDEGCFASKPTGATHIRGWITSLSFWLALIVAAGVYAAVALSPKLLANQRLRSLEYDNQVKLVALERDVDELEKIAGALENDPHYAAELARADFDAARPGEERITDGVSSKRELNIVSGLPRGAETPAEAGIFTPRVENLAQYETLLQLLAGDSTVRNAALSAAALIVVIAFTLFHDGHSDASPGGSLWDRYRKRA